MNILYMNQGGKGEWGAIRYSAYDIILLAESNIVKEGFLPVWESKTTPVMSIQEKNGTQRQVIKITDLDNTALQVRPMITFTTRVGVRVVFVHLKSGNTQYATSALKQAIAQIEKVIFNNPRQPILWIGDFNRAKNELMQGIGAKLLYAGGGQSQWDLDRAYISGDWSKLQVDYEIVAIAGADHGHVGIAVTITYKGADTHGHLIGP